MGPAAENAGMASFPVQVLLGIYLGILTGIIPALIAWTLGFVFKWVTNVTLPGLGVVVLGVAIAGVQGGLLALNDPSIRDAPNSVTLTVALLVVLMLTLYAHNRGDALGATIPRRISLRSIRNRTLSTDVVELVGGRGQVRVSVIGEVDDMEGYPSLPAEVRTEIREGQWTFPADLPISELETRLEDRLRTEFDLADASVTIDGRGRATVTAAPPAIGLSKRVPPGRRAVSIDALVPTGIARGDEVRVLTTAGTVEGTVLSARSGAPEPVASPAESGSTPDPSPNADAAGPAGAEPVEPTPTQPAGTTGGEGRVTVAVTRDDANRLLRADRGRVVVRSRGTRREYELLQLLRRAGKRVRRFAIGAETELTGKTIGEAAVLDTYGVAILAVREPDGWAVAPRGSTALDAGEEVFVVGTRDQLDRFAEVAT